MEIKYTIYIFWDIVIFLYFLLKNKLLLKVIGKSTNPHPVINLIICISAIIINNYYLSRYSWYTNLTWVKGSIQLPPLSFILIVIDFLSSIVVILLIFFKTRRITDTPAIFIDFCRLVVMFVMFDLILSTIWISQLSKIINYKNTCFKNQIVIDFAAYYYRYTKYPEKLEDFTKYRVNPANNSLIIYEGNDHFTAVVKDRMDNTIMQGYKDLQGLEMYNKMNTPYKFFTFYNIMNKNICSNSLVIPPEYNGDYIPIPKY